jgi:hypothetical protein
MRRRLSRLGTLPISQVNPKSCLALTTLLYGKFNYLRLSQLICETYLQVLQIFGLRMSGGRRTETRPDGTHIFFESAAVVSSGGTD